MAETMRNPYRTVGRAIERASACTLSLIHSLIPSSLPLTPGTLLMSLAPTCPSVATQREFDTLPVLSPENRKPVGYVDVADLLRQLEKGSLVPEDPLSARMKGFALKQDYQGEHRPEGAGTAASKLIVGCALYTSALSCSSHHARYRYAR